MTLSFHQTLRYEDPAGHVPSVFLGTSISFGVVDVVGPPGNAGVDWVVLGTTHTPTLDSAVPVGHFPSGPLVRIPVPSVDVGLPDCPVGVVDVVDVLLQAGSVGLDWHLAAENASTFFRVSSSIVELVIVDDLQAGSVGLDWQMLDSTENASTFFRVSSSIVELVVVDDLQNGASGDVVQIALFSDPASVGREPDGAPVVVPDVVDDLQTGSVGLD